jgi:hypothetical protein
MNKREKKRIEIKIIQESYKKGVPLHYLNIADEFM